MHHHIHHVHIFASHLDSSVRFYQDYFDGNVILDMELAGARNVFMKVGNGRIHFTNSRPNSLEGAAYIILGYRLTISKAW